MSEDADDVDRALPLAPPRRPRTLPILAALTAVGLLLAYVLPPVLVAGTAVAADGVLLPDRLDGYSLLNDTVERVPAGTALLTYSSGNWELFQTIQQVMVGVDGDSYRQLDVVYDGGHVTRSTFLAPDGRSVLVTEQFERSAAGSVVLIGVGASVTTLVHRSRRRRVWAMVAAPAEPARTRPDHSN